MSDVLRAVLETPVEPEPVLDVAAFHARLTTMAGGSPFDVAVRFGAAADRVAWAFGAGYQAALARLLGEPVGAALTALCATEAGGASPRAIQAEIRDGTLFGEKTYVTFGPAASRLLVLAREGMHEGRPKLGLFAVDAGVPGVALTTGPPTPFVPELPHAAVRFDGTPATRLPGDGWSDHVRPFRTVEDIHVLAATLAYLTARARARGAERAWIERALGLLVALAGLAERDPSAPSTHLALAGVEATLQPLVAEAEWWANAPADERDRWQRDRPLLGIAGKARAARTAKAWSAS